VSRRELSRRAAISEGTLRNWETEHDPALRTRRGPGRSVSSTVADVRAFCAAHPDLPAARRAVAHLDSPNTALDIESLRTILEAVLTAVRVSTAAHVELANHTTILGRDHSATLSRALHGLDDALTQITSARPGSG